MIQNSQTQSENWNLQHENWNKNLKTELKSYNLKLKLIINFIWLSKSENRSRKRHASMILAFRIEAKAQRHLKKWLLAARSTYQTVEY